MTMRPVTDILQQAEAALDQGQPLQAVRLCQTIVTRFPKYLRAYLLLGQAALQLGDLLLAEEAFQAARRWDPGALPALLGLSDIAEQRGDRELALRYCQAAWELAPWDVPLRHRLTRLSASLFGDGQLFLTLPALASSYTHQGRWTRAAIVLETALRDLSDRPDLEQQLAFVLWRAGRPHEAMTWAQRVLDRLPDAVIPLAVLILSSPDEVAPFLLQLHDVDLDGHMVTHLFADEDGTRWQHLLPSELPLIDDEVLTQQPEPAPALSPEPTISLEQEMALLDQLFRLPSPEEVLLSSSQPTAPVEPTPPREASPVAADESLLLLPSDEELEAARPADLPSAADLAPVDLVPGIEPFSPAEFGVDDLAKAEPSDNQHPPSTPVPADERVAETLAQLGVTSDLFDRARAAKQRLRETGVLPPLPPEQEPTAATTPQQETRSSVEVGASATPTSAVEPTAAEPPEGEATPAASPVTAQSASLAEVTTSASDSPEALLAAAQVHLDAGDVDTALHLFHRVFRLGPAYDQQLIPILNHIADAGGGSGAAADRLLGAIYRRQGAEALARRHYERSLRRR